MTFDWLRTIRQRNVRRLRRVEILETRCLLTTPNDLRFAEQVALNNVGQTGGQADADIDAPEAWDIQHDATRLVVAVVDSGIDYTHPDLYLNVWINQGEIPTSLRPSLRDTDGDTLITFRDLNQPINASLVSNLNSNSFIDAGDLLNDPRWENGVDEDGNERTDDLIGWDFVNSDNDPFDDNGHGTHVSGILAASGNNGAGVSGVVWNTNLMIVKFLDQRLSGDVSDAVSALDYVTEHRTRFNSGTAGAPDVRVSNNSWEIRTVTQSANSQLSNAIAQQLQAGILLVAAAGNGVDDRPLNLDTDPSPSFPAAYAPPMGPQLNPIPDAVLSVAASDTSDRLVFNSNFGATSVDLAAPGLDVLSTEPGGLFGTRTGTSMAAPMVSGTAALLWARYPEATSLEIKQAILRGVDAKPTLTGAVLTGGRLNAVSTLNFDTVAPRAALTNAPSILVRGGTTQDVTVRFTDNVAVNVSSLGASDITITRADGVTFNTTVSVQSVSPNANGSPVDIVYRLTAPSGGWTNADNATYRLTLQGNEVADTVGNKAAGGVLGSFVINIPNPDDLRVTSTVDSVDGTTGDGRPEDSQGRATLRAAIQESNFSADANTIKLPAGTFTLTLAGAGEDNAATGDLDIRQNLTIEGASTSTTIIDAAGLDRVFQVHAGVSLTLRNLTVRGGLTSDGLGGGGLLNAGFVTLDHVEVTNNTASTGGGGGVLNNVTTTSSNDTLTLLDSTLSFNIATGAEGGGLKNLKGKATLLRSTLHNNSAGTSGGGLFVQANTVTVTNSTVTTNTSGTIGGGLHLNAGVLLLTNVTTTLNTADSTGGGIARTTGTARLVNTIVAGNSLIQSAPNVDVAGTISASGSGNNFIGIVGDAVGFDASRQDIIGTAAAPQNANLAPLANYGGPTLTHRPNVGSGVIDKGLAVSGLTTDQRNLARSTDGDNNSTSTPDIGAVEFVLFGSISGLAYHDFDQDGQRDPDEPTLSGWTIFLDTNNNGVLNNGERSTVTAGNGSYIFNTVAPGNYVIAEVLRSGWLQTQPTLAAPTSGRHTFTLAPGEDHADFVFGNHALPGEIRGTVFLDSDGDTVRDVGEVAYPNLTVYLDANHNGVLDADELSTETDSSGSYAFFNLPTARTRYSVTLVGPRSLDDTAAAVIDLNTLNEATGFRINGIDLGDNSGISVSTAGDVNGDGINDLLIGADQADPNGKSSAGESYVVFGKSDRFGATLDLATLDGTNGFRLNGIDADDRAGQSVSSAGDVNGDGFDDLLIGASRGDPNGKSSAGESYVVFGKASGFPTALELNALDGSTGFRLDGIDPGDYSGQSVSQAGDVNGDGFDDLLIGASAARVNGRALVGETYVVFGRASDFTSPLALATLDGSNGFRLNGIDTDDRAGRSVSSAGDVNGDGFDDLLIGAYRGDPNGKSNAGETYVVFGKASGFPAALELSTMDGSTGFRLDGVDPGDYSGISVSGAGDVNGDGFDDVLIGATGADPNGRPEAGESYLVFGRARGFTTTLDLTTLNGTTGFRLDGVANVDVAGRSLSTAGDVNGDGFDDLLIGAPGADASYVVFGKSRGFAAALSLGELNGKNGFRISGVPNNGETGSSVSNVGDINGDGFDDVLIGANRSEPGGKSYVVFGRATNTRSIVLDGGEVRAGVSFGLQPPMASISGQLFRDHNRNGVWEEGETVVAGANVFIDSNENARRDTGEPMTVTDSEGRYTFSNLDAFTSIAQPNRTYRVVELVSDEQLEFVQTVPQRSIGTVDVTTFAVSDQLRAGVDIATDGDGGFLLTGSDGAASGFNERSVFWVSGDGEMINAIASANDPQGISSDGVYAYWADQNSDSSSTNLFRQLLSGGPAELVANSSIGTGATNGLVAVSGVDVVMAAGVGGEPMLIAADSVSGRVARLPAQANVASDDIEMISAARYSGFLRTARAQYLEENEGVVYVADPGVDRSLDQPPQIVSIPLTGSTFTTLFEGNLPDYTEGGTTIPGGAPRGIAVQGSTIYVTSDRAIYSMPMTGGTPTLLAADERFDQLGELTYFDDALYVIDNGNALDPQATIWKVDLLTGQTPSRSVHVDETSNSRAWDITLTPGMVAENVDFARYDPNAAVGASGDKSITGRLFQDLNGNGTADSGENGLVGQVVFLDLNRNGVLDLTDRQTVTLAGDDPTTTNVVEQPGTYVFTGLEPGLYDVLPAPLGIGTSVTTSTETSLVASDLPLANTGTPRAVTTGDWDRDGDQDVVLVDAELGAVSLLRNSGDQSFETAQRLTVSGVPFGAVLGNLNGDTLPDLAVSRLQLGVISLYRNLGNGQFEELSQSAQQLRLSSGPSDGGFPSVVISGDFNGDGLSDLAATDISASSHRVFVWRNTGNLTFAAPQILTTTGRPGGLVAADFNGDGALDLAATDVDADRVFVWLNLNNATGTFNTTARQVTVGDQPIALAAGNVNGSGGVDLVVANQGAGSLTVLSNDGAANFTTLTTLASTLAPQAVTLVDLDGQAGLDLVVAQGGADSAQPLVVYFNTGASTSPFESSVAYGAASLNVFNAVATSSGFAIAAANFDGDQDSDLVVVNSGAKTASTLRTGPGRIAQTVRLTANGASPTNINFGVATSYSTSFNTTSGELLVTLSQPSEVELGGLAGFVTLRVNGILDTELTVAAADVRSLRVIGTDQGDRLDARAVSEATGFTAVGGVVVTLEGLAGADTLSGSDFADLLLGGTDADTLVGGNGNDTLDGGVGNDLLSGNAGTNTLLGTADDLTPEQAFSVNVTLTGSDTLLIATAGEFVSVLVNNLPFGPTTRLAASLLAINVQGGAGDNVIDLSGVTLSAFPGLVGVTVNGSDGNDSIVGSEFADSLNGDLGNDTLNGGLGNDSMIGGSNNDLLNGGAGADLLQGVSGNDTLIGGTGADNLSGGTGTDVVRDSQDASWTLTNTSLVATIAGVVTTDTLSGFEIADLSGGPSRNRIDASGFTSTGLTTLIGGGGHDTILGTAGADSIITATGFDLIFANGGADIVFSGSGNDTINGGDGNDNLNGQNGDDSINGDAGNDVLVGGSGIDTINGGDDSDFILGQADPGLLSGGNGNDSIQGFTANDTLNGDAGNDKLYGSIGNDVLNGGDGNDSAQGDSGNDTITGGAGLDTLSGGVGNDSVDGGADFDQLRELADADFTVVGMNVISVVMGSDTDLNLERISLQGGPSANFLNAAQATVQVFLFGDAGNDSLQGGSRNDFLSGGLGNDTLNGGSGNDTLEGNEGDDGLSGYTGNDSLIGGSGRDTLFGHDGSDTLLGGTDDDALIGGGGTTVTGDLADTLNGEAGSDVLRSDPSNLDTRTTDGFDTLSDTLFASFPGWVDRL